MVAGMAFFMWTGGRRYGVLPLPVIYRFPGGGSIAEIAVVLAKRKPYLFFVLSVRGQQLLSRYRPVD